LSIVEARSALLIIDDREKIIRLRFKRINAYMRNGVEQKEEVQRDTSAYRWRELDGDNKQEPDNTLTKEIHW
jgi:hypothetical protein